MVMSDYKIVNGKKVRVCKYGCDTELVWSDEISGFIETKGGVAHTKERCKTVKESKQKQDCKNLNDDFMQYLMDQLNQGYSEYKKNHPDFAKVVEKEEGKPEETYGK
jgi:hypothetical protein